MYGCQGNPNIGCGGAGVVRKVSGAWEPALKNYTQVSQRGVGAGCTGIDITVLHAERCCMFQTLLQALLADCRIVALGPHPLAARGRDPRCGTVCIFKWSYPPVRLPRFVFYWMCSQRCLPLGTGLIKKRESRWSAASAYR